MYDYTLLEHIAGFTRAQIEKESPKRNLRLGTVDSLHSSGNPKITFDGESTLSSKLYPVLATYVPRAGDRVVLVPVGHTYVVVGALTGNTVRPFKAGGSDLTNTSISGGQVNTWVNWGPEVMVVTNPKVDVTVAAAITGRMVHTASTGVDNGACRVGISLDNGATWNYDAAPFVKINAASANWVMFGGQTNHSGTPTGDIRIRGEFQLNTNWVDVRNGHINFSVMPN